MMAAETLEPTIDEMRTGVIDDIVGKHIPHDAYPEAWDIAGPEAGGPREAQPRSAGRRLGEGGRHRRRGGRRAPAQGGRRGLRRARQAQLARGDALHREAGDPADARPSLARASGDARPPASGDRLARHGAARSAERVQVRGVRALPAADRAMARRGDRADVARRGALPGPRAAASADAVPASPTQGRPTASIRLGGLIESGLRGAVGARPPASRSPNATRAIRPPGDGSAGTSPVLAAPARSSSIATVRSPEQPVRSRAPRRPERRRSPGSPRRSTAPGSKNRGVRRGSPSAKRAA